ncbi:MAG: DUF1501 domain-containing protein [Phycisphaerales bacterium]
MSYDLPLTAFTRRQFLSTGLVMASAAVAVPHFIQASAMGLQRAQPGAKSIPGVNEDNVFVVIQLSGGNDGLNTVVPFGDQAYYRARPGIGVRADRVIKLSKAEEGLHPSLAPLADLYNEGLLGIVQGVGYPNPNRSHFKSMDIWHTAETSGTGEGWLGKYFDSECVGFGAFESGGRGRAPATPATSPKLGKGHNPQIGIAIGASAPLAMKGRAISAVSFESADLFRWTGAGEGDTLAQGYEQITRAGLPAGVDPDSNTGFLTRTALDAQISSDMIRKAVGTRPRTQYPNSELARQLQMVASMIQSKLSTRVYYVSMGGCDTHSGQGGEQGRHANLLGQYAAAIKAFYADLKAQGNDGRVLTMTFSEFGRRVGQNASQGTDHGTAAPMFLTGPMVTPGVLNPHPSLSDLDQGDLKYTVDFRQVYASVLEKWLTADARRILGSKFDPAPIFRKS